MTTLRSVAYSLLAWSFLRLAARDATGHPGSGIVVDDKGSVFFQGGPVLLYPPAGGATCASSRSLLDLGMIRDEGHREARARRDATSSVDRNTCPSRSHS